MTLNKNDPNYLRLNEYCNLTFEELLTSKKFESEFGTVKEISQEFLKSQYNDFNIPFIFYNIKKKETADEYLYNMINLSNSYEHEIEDDEEDDDFDFEGDTSFGKFYSEDASKFFGNITYIKKKKSYVKKNNKYDSNMIIIAPFLFKLVTKNNKKELIKKYNNDPKNVNVFRTFAHQNTNESKNRREDINNLFICPFSLEAEDNVLKKDDNNLLYNIDKIKDQDDDLILETGNNDNVIIYDKIVEEPIDNESKSKSKNKKNKKRYSVNLNDVMSQKNNRRSIFSFMRFSRPSNCCNDLYISFSQIEFIKNLKIKFKNYISKKVMEKIIIPESRDYEYIDKDFLVFLNKKESEEDHSLIVKNKKLIIFLFIFFIYYMLIIITANYEIMHLFIK